MPVRCSNDDVVGEIAYRAAEHHADGVDVGVFTMWEPQQRVHDPPRVSQVLDAVE